MWLGILFYFTGYLLSICWANINDNSGRISARIVTHEGSPDVIMCYYTSWSAQRTGDGKFEIEDIDPKLCTHYVYCFAGLGDDNKVKVIDRNYDLADQYGANGYGRLVGLKNRNFDARILIAIGGWTEGSAKYSAMAANPTHRATFVDSVTDFLATHNFDGVDMHWLHPTYRGGSYQDKANFVLLLKEIRKAFARRGYLLSTIIPGSPYYIDQGYDIPGISQNVDYMNIAGYYYHGDWETRTGHHSPLFSRPDGPPGDEKLTVNYTISYLLSKGAERSKLLLGIPTFGKSFTLADRNNHGLEAPIKGAGWQGVFTGEKGLLGFNEICAYQKKSPDDWVVVRDPNYKTPYAYANDFWVGYDDSNSVELKSRYIKEMNLGGAMVWSLDTDDFKGNCSETKYPLIKAIKRELDVNNEPLTEKPENPTSTENPNLTDCTTNGLFRNPSDCRKFHRCLDEGDGFKKTEFLCPQGTVFAQRARLCLSPNSVLECRNYYLNNH